MGCFGFEGRSFPFLAASQKAEAAGILVVPALAVETQTANGRSASLGDFVPNALPFWYWFSEIFVPVFVGDCRKKVLTTAANMKSPDDLHDEAFGVHYTVEVGLGNEIVSV